MSDAREAKTSGTKRKIKTSSDGGGTIKRQKKKKSDVPLQDDDEDFPRGGSNPLTPLEVRQIRDEAEKDILFGTSTPGSQTKQKSKKKKQKLNDSKPSIEDSFVCVKEETMVVDTLTFKKLSKGVLLLGVVQEVFDFELVVSLPNNLSGCVHITNINKAFTSQLEEEASDNEDAEPESLTRLQKFFPVGTIVKCVVVSIDSTKHGHSKVRLSVDPADVNSSLTPSTISPNMALSGYVTSIEDHGYAISFGIEKVKGFLSKTNVSGELCVGQVVDGLVMSISGEKRLVQLQCDKSKIKTSHITQKDKIVFSSLLPGMLVKATVKKVSSNGLAVTFLGGFDGSVYLPHLKKHGGSGDDLEKIYPIKTRVLSRIAYIYPSTKTVGLSVLEQLVENYEAFSFPGFSIGDVIEEATVIRSDQTKGILLQLCEEVSGYAHISRLSDEHFIKVDKRFKAGTKHRCRILSFNTLVGLALVTLEKSVIEEPFIRYQDIKPGVVITGKVQSLVKSGMLVALSDHIRGYCHLLHFADVLLKHPEKKFREGKTVKCRVLQVEPERKRLRLTHKKSLVNSELPPITSYADAKLGLKTHGFISSIKDYGCIVNFYNNVYGLVPKTELGLKASEDLREAFYVGQVVTCVVTSCSLNKRKLALSFNTSVDPSLLSSKLLEPGTVVDVDIVGKTATGLDVQIKPSNTPAFLPLMHLSDHMSHCGPLLEVFSPSLGENVEVRTLSNVLYYGRNKDKSLIMSRKQSLIKTASGGCLVRRFEDLKVGMILPGFVRQLMLYGVFIEFSPYVYGLAPNSFLSDKYISDASQYFKAGQSALAKIVEVDSDRRRFLVSLRPSDCYPEKEEEPASDADNRSINLLEEYIKEREDILEHLRSVSEDGGGFANVLPDSLVAAKVTTLKNYGTTFLLEGGVEGFALPQLTKGVDVAVGEVFDAFVLDYDIENKRVYLTVDSNIVRQRKETKRKNKTKPSAGEIVSAVVQIIHADYLVVLLPKHGLRVAFVPVKAHLNDIRDPASRFTVGQTCEAIVERYVRSKLDKRKYLIVSVDNNEENQEGIKPGEITTGVVKSIKDLQVNVHLSGGRYHGRIHVTEILDDPVEGEQAYRKASNTARYETEIQKGTTQHQGTNPLTHYKCGEKVRVKVVGFKNWKTHKFLPVTHRNLTKAVAELSTRPSRLRDDDNNNEEEKPVDKGYGEYKEGEKILCFVKSIRSYDIWMSVSTSLDGRVTLLDASTDIKVLKNLSSHFKVGTGYQCTVLQVNEEHQSLNLSLSGCEVKKGQVVPGKITKILPHKGVAVMLPGRKYGMVFLTDFSDSFKENPLDEYSLNQLVRCYVLDVNKDGHIDLSTRPSRTEGSTSDDELAEDSEVDKDVQTLSDIEEGDLVRGYVKSVVDIGVFVRLSRHVVARVQIKNLSHFFVKNWKPLFPVGKLVKGKVLSIDPLTNYIELSLKGKDVGGKDPAPKPERRKTSKSTSGKRVHENSDSEDDDEEKISSKKIRKEDNVEEASDMEEESENESSKSSSEDSDKENVDEEQKPRLKLSGRFDWNSFKDDEMPTADDAAVDSDDDHDNASDAEESAQVARKKSKRAKRAAKKAEEDFLYKTEQALLNQEKGPQTAEDFDRVLLSTPNDSLLWLQYMAFYLHLTEVDKARAVAERALKSISFREESEKFNVWIALLNLENSYGTQDTLIKVFQRALQENEPKNIFKQLINIYVGSNKFELAEQLYQTMVKRFKSSKKVWIEYAAYLMERGDVQAARNVLQRSLGCLEKRKHIETIARFAMLEFKHGEPERGRTLLDNVLTSYPKRTDIWSVYVDVLTKNGDIAAARRLLEREVTLKLSSRKMKFVFKKYLDFEKKHGDESSMESVKKLAEEYVKENAE